VIEMATKIKYTALLPEIVRPTCEIHILSGRCKGCGFCIEFCPRKVLEVSGEFNEKGFFPPVAKSPEQCVNCRLCELICPDMAIYIVGEEPERCGDGIR